MKNDENKIPQKYNDRIHINIMTKYNNNIMTKYSNNIMTEYNINKH